LSLSLWGQIKILSPAMRARIGVDRMLDRNDRMGEVLGASIEIQKEINLNRDRAKKEKSPSVSSVPLW